MDSKEQPAQPTKKSLNPKTLFWVRTAVSAVIVLIVWTLISGIYIEFVKSIVIGLVKAAGYYREYQPKVSDALMSPAIPFLVLMIGTWGAKLFWNNGKFNLKLTLWTVFGTLGLMFVSIYGQYLAFFSSVTGNSSDLMINVISFFIATMPVLLPIILWTVLSYKELGNMFFKKQ
ncbi:MAG: hypothetical protein KA140_07590 [Caldisericia bacterium]|nr:hypothetical protein [Caldisericia bacterium]